MNAIHNPMHVHDIHATIRQLAWVGSSLKLTHRHNSQDVRLTDVYGNVIHDILT